MGRLGATERVLIWIEDEIRAGRLSVGERLPSERALADRLGVGRSAVREAKARLAGDGRVREGRNELWTARRDGTVMLREWIESTARSQASAKKVSLARVLEARRVLLAAAMTFALRRTSSRKRKILAEKVTEFGIIVRTQNQDLDAKEIAQAHCELLLCAGSLSKNPAVQACLFAVDEVLNRLAIWRFTFDHRKDCVAWSAELVRALDARNGVAMRRLVKTKLRDLDQQLQEAVVWS
ncbi:MAG: FadR/GntR family transcriptional regulator [Myxococcaceae bacterium]